MRISRVEALACIAVAVLIVWFDPAVLGIPLAIGTVAGWCFLRALLYDPARHAGE